MIVEPSSDLLLKVDRPKATETKTTAWRNVVVLHQ